PVPGHLRRQRHPEQALVLRRVHHPPPAPARRAPALGPGATGLPRRRTVRDGAAGTGGEPIMSTRYTGSGGKVVLTLEEPEGGGYIVTSPLDPELITEAETIEEAFANARDAAQALKQARVKLFRRLSSATKER